MKQLLFIFSLILLFSHNLYSQKDYENESVLRFKITPVTMIDYTPRLRFGFEFLSKNKLGYSIDFGIGNEFLNGWRLDGVTFGNDYSFFELRPEIKYLVKRKKRITFYFATELFYLRMQDLILNRSYQKENSNNEITYESARFSKQKTGLHLKAGFDIIVFKRFDIDFYAGVGGAIRKINYTDVINPIEGDGPIDVDIFNSSFLYEGESNILHMTLGFKIGYTLWTK